LPRSEPSEAGHTQAIAPKEKTAESKEEAVEPMKKAADSEGKIMDPKASTDVIA
jgi:hypothetical protein